MTLISSSIPNFVNGVSQQPYTLRLASQLEKQENGLSTVSKGLKKRPPTRHIAKIQNSALSQAYLHTMNRDTTEQYVCVVTNGDLKVYDLAGNEKTVNFPNGKTYLNTSGSVPEMFSAMTVADYTFVVNKGVTVTTSTSTTSYSPYRRWAMVNVKMGNYGKTYTLTLNGVDRATYSVPNGGAAADSVSASTDNIAAQLNTQLNTLFNTWRSTPVVGSTDYYSEVFGSAIYIYRSGTSSADFLLTCKDGFNGNAMTVIKDGVQRFSDLPTHGVRNGLIVEVSGDPTSGFDNYYVKFEADADCLPGLWKECPQSGISVGLNAATMPHVLVRESDGTFTFKQATWDNRLCGDDNSNSHPSFVGRPINDVFFFRNRLGFLSDENVIFSEAGTYFNFYRTTVTQLLDSDPIDVSVSNTKVSILRFAVPFEKKLFIFSDQTQFVIDQAELLTPKSVSIDVSTEYPCSAKMRPVAAGNSIYYASERGPWSSMREYFVDSSNDTNESVEITAHIPEYLPSGLFKTACAPNEDILLLLSNSNRSEVFVYKYFTANGEKLQSSWSKWVFPSTDTILHIEFINSDAWFVISRSTGVFLEKLSVSDSNPVTTEPFYVLLDRKVQVNTAQLSYSSGYTTINSLPYTPSDGTYYLIARNDNGTNSGKLLAVTWDGSAARVLGNITGWGGTFTFGRTYRSTFGMSTITMKEPATGGGQKSDTEGRLQLRKVGFNVADTGYFLVEVTPEGRDTYTYTYTGKRLGSTAVVGESPLSTDRFTVPVVSRNVGTTIELINDLPIPCSFLSADWEGFYVKRNKSV